MRLSDSIPGVAQARVVGEAMHNPKMRIAAGGVACLAFAGCGVIATGIEDGSRYVPTLSQKFEALPGHAVVIDVNPDIGIEHVVGYRTQVKGAKAEVQSRIGIGGFSFGVPMTKVSETFDGIINDDLCLKETGLTVHYDSSLKKTVVNLAPNSITVCTATDVPSRLFTPDKQLASLGGDILNSFIRDTPGLDSLPVLEDLPKNENSLQSKLQNYAEIEANLLSAKQCEGKVWPQLRGFFANVITARTVKAILADPKAQDAKLTAKDIPAPEILYGGQDIHTVDIGYTGSTYDDFAAQMKKAKKPVNLSNSSIGDCTVPDNLPKTAASDIPDAGMPTVVPSIEPSAAAASGSPVSAEANQQITGNN